MDNEKRKGVWFWPILVVTFLGAQIVISSTSLYFALSDPAVKVEKDYYNKAINWDQRNAAPVPETPETE